MRRNGFKSRHIFQQCQMLIGDSVEARGQCQSMVSTTAHWQGQQLKVCEFHKGVIKNHEQRRTDPGAVESRSAL